MTLNGKACIVKDLNHVLNRHLGAVVRDDCRCPSHHDLYLEDAGQGLEGRTCPLCSAGSYATRNRKLHHLDVGGRRRPGHTQKNEGEQG